MRKLWKYNEGYRYNLFFDYDWNRSTNEGKLEISTIYRTIRMIVIWDDENKKFRFYEYDTGKEVKRRLSSIAKDLAKNVDKDLLELIGRKANGGLYIPSPAGKRLQTRRSCV